ncbi:MAG: F0F1 ATP synthase subunit gamma [Anaerolineales bacterium]|nr:F0F1 ATP synthase subunit gamma [Anaerolineales bacterium]
MESKSGDRLENIRSVEPILDALRTIALGNWHAALRRREWVLEFARRTGGILAEIPSGAKPPAAEADAGGRQTAALVIGSERGLCGSFNRVLAERTAEYLEDRARRGESVRLYAAGSLAARTLERMGMETERFKVSATAALPTFETADALARDWLSAYEAQEVDRVDAIYNAYLGAGRNETRIVRLIPPQIPRRPAAEADEAGFAPILETEPLGLIVRVVLLQLSAQVYACLLESSAAENSARFQLLEEARQNIDRLVEELEAEAAQAHRQSITRELQILAAGSGLLRGE